MKKAVLAVDAGTTGITALVVDRDANVLGRGYSEFRQFYPQPGWVEHDPEEIWQTTCRVIESSLQQAGLAAHHLAAIGITNQRETTVLWNRVSGKPVHNAVVWQCRRTADLCAELKSQGQETLFRAKTGLVIDPYFSATKIRWLLDHVPEARSLSARGELIFGTIDSWLLWKLSGGTVHATDHTNASRTLLYNIHTKSWDDELLRLLDIPASILPRAYKSSEVFGYTASDSVLGGEIPISGIAGDQQAALYGQGCNSAGMIKNTYGTGCFIMMNTGEKAVESHNGLLTTLACDPLGRPVYALEGSVFIGGAVIQWLRDEVGLLKNTAESESLARAVEDNGGVYIVPAFVGLGAPYWDMNARGVIVGLTRGAKREHLVRAALEAVAYQSRDVINVMQLDAGMPITELRADGGAAKNDFLMQFQADILDLPIDRPQQIESTALGAAFLAGLATGFWETPDQLDGLRRTERVFRPAMSKELRQKYLDGWHQAVGLCLRRNV